MVLKLARKRGLILGVAWLWGCGIVVGAGWAYRYAATPSPLRVPATAKKSLPTARPTLVLFLHPQCECSRATLVELARLLPDIGAAASTRIYFFSPSGRPAAWVRSSLWREAGRIPGVELIADEDGREADRRGAVASGEVFLYERTGELVFHGGITPARGHSGESRGRMAILDWVAGRPPRLRQTRSFGCALRSQASASGEARS